MRLAFPRLTALRGWAILPLIYAGVALATCAVPAPAYAQSGGIYQATPPTLANGQRNDFRIDADGSLIVSDTPSATAAAAAAAAVSNLPAGTLVAKPSTGNLYGFSITTGANPGYVMIFNRTTAATAGATTAGTATNNLQVCMPVAALTALTVNYTVPIRFSAGISVAFSSTACGTLTLDTTAVHVTVLDL